MFLFKKRKCCKLCAFSCLWCVCPWTYLRIWPTKWELIFGLRTCTSGTGMRRSVTELGQIMPRAHLHYALFSASNTAGCRSLVTLWDNRRVVVCPTTNTLLWIQYHYSNELDGVPGTKQQRAQLQILHFFLIILQIYYNKYKKTPFISNVFIKILKNKISTIYFTIILKRDKLLLFKLLF